MKKWIFFVIFAVSLNSGSWVWSNDDLYLGDLEEIGSQHVWDYSETGGNKLLPWNERNNLSLFEDTTFKKSSELDIPYKGQTYSLTTWNNIDPEKFLNIDIWFLENSFKSQRPEWIENLRTNRQIELMGRVISCIGHCYIYRGIIKHPVDHLSRIYEGDEFETDSNSVAWIFLNEGSLIRVSPEGALNFQEINFSENKVFLKTRLNKGHIFWYSRSENEMSLDLAPETDSQFLPLKIMEANQEYFERKIAQGQSDPEQTSEVMHLNEPAIKNQFEAINNLKKENKVDLERFNMVVAPNGTLVFNEGKMDVLHLPGGNTYFKSKSEKDLKLQLRGIQNLDETTVSMGKWFEIVYDGRSYKEVEDILPVFNLIEFITKRIKTLELARELWIQRFTNPILQELKNKSTLATQIGYVLWDSEKFTKRIEFLKTEMARIETSNLSSIEKLMTKIHGENNIPRDQIPISIYDSSLNHYLKGLKKRYTVEKTQVREMSDLQYYIWTLKNGKI